MRLVLLMFLTLGLALCTTACGDNGSDDSNSDAVAGEGAQDEGLAADESGDDDEDGDESSDDDEDGDDEDDDEDALPEVDCMGEVPGYADVAAIDTCTNCHSTELSGAARNKAPPEDNFNTYAGAKKGAMEMVQEVSEGKMPPAGSGFTLTDAEKEQLYTWALCGAPQ